jgi:hypothetical protein
MLRIQLSDIAEATQKINRYADVTVLVEEGEFQIIGEPKVLAEFELILAMEVAFVNFQTPLDPEDVRTAFVDLVELREERSSYLNEPNWVYTVEVLGDLEAHEIRQL